MQVLDLVRADGGVQCDAAGIQGVVVIAKAARNVAAGEQGSNLPCRFRPDVVLPHTARADETVSTTAAASPRTSTSAGGGLFLRTVFAVDRSCRMSLPFVG